MPILGPTPQACFDRFLGHVGQVLASILGDSASATFGALRHTDHKDPTRLVVGFRQGKGPTTVALKTAFGPLHFYMGQALTTVRDGKGEPWRLRTKEYWYRIQTTPELTAKAVMRWEYVSDAPKNGWCRHHVQFPAAIPMPVGTWDFDKLHLPSGWVSFEEVMRFLIVDLEVKPTCGKRWPKVLADSEAAFFERFTGKRYKPPAG